MAPLGGSMFPSGTNLTIGAQRALPSFSAIAGQIASSIKLCFPVARYGPFSSMPPVEMMDCCSAIGYQISNFHKGQFFYPKRVTGGNRTISCQEFFVSKSSLCNKMRRVRDDLACHQHTNSSFEIPEVPTRFQLSVLRPTDAQLKSRDNATIQTRNIERFTDLVHRLRPSVN